MSVFHHRKINRKCQFDSHWFKKMWLLSTARPSQTIPINSICSFASHERRKMMSAAEPFSTYIITGPHSFIILWYGRNLIAETDWRQNQFGIIAKNIVFSLNFLVLLSTGTGRRMCQSINGANFGSWKIQNNHSGTIDRTCSIWCHPTDSFTAYSWCGQARRLHMHGYQYKIAGTLKNYTCKTHHYNRRWVRVCVAIYADEKRILSHSRRSILKIAAYSTVYHRFVFRRRQRQ